MAEQIIDVVTRLSYEVVGADNIQRTTDNIKKQTDNITRLEGQLQNLNEAYQKATAEGNTKRQDTFQRSIDKTTKAITQQTKALQLQVSNSKPIQQAIQVELGLIQKLTDKINDLRQARERQTTKSGIADINNQIAKAKEELEGLNSLGQGGGILSALFGGSAGGIGKQVLNGTLLGLGFGGGFGLITRVVSGLVEEFEKLGDEMLHADEYAKKLQDSTRTTTDAIIKETDALADYRKQVADIAGSGAQATQQAVDAAKARGVVNGQVFKANTEIFQAEQSQRERELFDLKQQAQTYREISILVAEAGVNGDFEKAFRRLPEGISTTTIDLVKKSISEADKEGLSNEVLVDQLSKANLQKAEQNTIAQNKIKDDIKNADIKRQSDLSAEIYQKERELQIQLAEQRESYRQLQERQDVESVDKIVRDTAAKYKLLNEAINRDREKTIKEQGTLSEKEQAQFNKKITLNTLSETQERNNLLFDLEQKSFLQKIQLGAQFSQTSVTQLGYDVATGLPDYDKLVELLDRQNEAKKDALRTSFIQQAATITDATQVAEAQNLLNNELNQVDKKGYSDRLELATIYYGQLAKIIKDTSGVLATQADTDILNAGGTDTQIGRRRARAAAERAKQDAQRLLPDAQSALDRSNNAAINATTPEATKAAAEEALKQKAIVEGLNNDIAKSNKTTSDINRDITLERIGLFQNFVNATVQGYDIIAEARQKDLDREISVREQRVDAAYKLAERGNTQALAIEQKALDQRIQERRKAALQEQAINSALTVSNSLLAVAQAAVAGKGVLTVPLIAATIAAIGVGFSQAYALNQAQKTGFYKGGYTGDGGKYDEAGTVHKGEFVIDKEKTARYRPLLEAIHKGEPIGRLLRPDMVNSGGGFASKQQFNELGNKLDGVIEAINGKTVNVSQSVDKGGVFQMVKETEFKNNMLWSR